MVARAFRENLIGSGLTATQSETLGGKFDDIEANFERKAFNPPVAFKRLPNNVRSFADYHSPTRNMKERDGYIWTTFWDVTSQGLKICRRKYPNGDWVSMDLTTALGTVINFADTAVSVGADTITLPAHGLVTGQSLLYNANGGTITVAGVGNLNGFTVYAIVVDANTIKIATTAETARSGASYDITATTAGNLKLTWNFPVIASQTDSHYNVTWSFDAAGRIHIFGHQHDSRLHYMYCDVSDAGFTTAANWHHKNIMVSEAFETQATYMHPVQLKSDELILMFRDGFSGNGLWRLYVLNSAANTWSQRSVPIGKGTSPVYNAYPVWHVDVDRNLHLAWSWTDTGAGDTSHDIVYAKTEDNGATWKNSRGQTLTLPIETTNCENVAVIPTGSQLMANGGIWVENGVVHLAWLRYDGSTGSQYYYAKSTSPGSWSVPFPVTNWNYLYDTTLAPVRNNRISQPHLCVYGNRLILMYRNNVAERGSLRIMDITNATDFGTVTTDAPIVLLDLMQMECPFYDERDVRENGRMHFIVVQCPKEGNGSAEEYGVDNYWSSQLGLQITVDLAQLDIILRQACRLPGIKVLNAADGHPPNGYSRNFNDTNVNVGTDVITIVNHGMVTGQVIYYQTNGGSVTGLTNNSMYFVINASVDTIKLATTAANAAAGTAIDLTAVGAGNLRIFPITPILSTIAPGDDILTAAAGPNVNVRRENIGETEYGLFRATVFVQQMTSGTFTARIRQHRLGSTDSDFDIMTSTSTAGERLQSPWRPLSQTPTTDQDWSLQLLGRVSANLNYVSAAYLEYGYPGYV